MATRQLTRYDDARLDDPDSLFSLHVGENFYEIHGGVSGRLTFNRSRATEFFTATAVLQAYHYNQMQPPSEAEAEAWQQDEADRLLLQALSDYSPEDLRRAARLLEGADRDDS